MRLNNRHLVGLYYRWARDRRSYSGLYGYIDVHTRTCNIHMTLVSFTHANFITRAQHTTGMVKTIRVLMPAGPLPMRLCWRLRCAPLFTQYSLLMHMHMHMHMHIQIFSNFLYHPELVTLLLCVRHSFFLSFYNHANRMGWGWD